MVDGTDQATAINLVTTLHIEGSVAVIVIDSPPVNALGAEVRRGIQAALAAASMDTAVDAIVLMCGGRTFFAGADIREIGKPMVEPTLRHLQRQVEESEKPVVAAMHGSALGGGLELAMAAHFRIALATTKFGFPEVKLGLLPGAGGTQRLPRLIGVEAALSMMTAGDPITAREADELGLIDKTVEGDALLPQAVAFAAGLANTAHRMTKTRDKPAFWHRRGEGAENPRQVETLRARYRGFAAAQNIIESVTNALTMSFDEGIAAEAALFEALKASPQSAALRYGFFAERQALKMPELAEGEHPTRIERIAILAGGVQASAIIQAAQAAGIDVVEAEAASRVEPVDLIVVTEAPLAQPPLFNELARRPGIIVAAPVNLTDSLKLSDGQSLIGIDLGDPSRAPRSIEIIARGASAHDVAGLSQLARKLNLTSAVTAASDRSVGERLRRARDFQCDSLLEAGVPLVQIRDALSRFGMAGFAADAGDTPGAQSPPQDQGDILDSILLAIANQAASLVDEAAVIRPSDIDVLAVPGLGWPGFEGGPLYWMDTRGLDRTVSELRELERRFGAHFAPSHGLIDHAGKGQTFVKQR